MKRSLIVIIIFIISFSSGSSQWIQQSAPPNTGILLSVDFLNASDGVACGWIAQINNFTGRIIRTSNGGNNWISSSLPDSIRSCVIVQMINSQTGYIAGAYNVSAKKNKIVTNISDLNTLKFSDPALYRFYLLGRDTTENYKGIFLKTTNGGANWYPYGSLPSGISYLTGMKFFDAGTGYVLADTNAPGYPVSSKVLKTTNGGLNWSSRYLPDSILFALDMNFLNVNTGFVSGAKLDGAWILRTVNGGMNWSEYKIQNAAQVQSVDFSNANTGFLVAIGYPPSRSPLLVYKTVNTGISWELKTSFSLGDIILETIDFADNTGKGIVVGEGLSDYYIFRTTNFGDNWSVYTKPGMFLIGTRLLDANNWYVTGGDPIINPGSIILHSTNGGQVFVGKIGTAIPHQYELKQNYPNPFNSSTIIEYSLPENANVKLEIFSLLGRKIAVLFCEYQQAGYYRFLLDAEKAVNINNSGIYIYRITARNFTKSAKMIYMK